MTGRLVEALREVDPDVTAAELSDAIWLLAEVNRRSVSPSRTPPDDVSPAETQAARPGSGPPGGAPPVPSPSAERPARPPEAREVAPSDAVHNRVVADVEPMAEWHLPQRGRVLDPPGWLPARSPGADHLPATLAASRALRPLHRRAPSRTAVVVDEEATARLAAEQDLLLPVWRATPDRWLDLVLVVDSSSSMALWRSQLTGLQAMLEQLGAFRDIRCYHLDGDTSTSTVVLHPGTYGPAGAGHDPGELIDPSRRRAVLVVSDGVGAAWSGQALNDALRLWARSGPVAIVQTLPQRLWRSCRPSLRSVRLRSPRRGATNAQLEVRAFNGESGVVLPGGSVAVPVLELEPRWLRPWATLVAAPGPEALPFTVFPVGPPSPDIAVRSSPHDGTPDRSGGPEEEGRSAQELLEAFHAQASTDALALVQWLAAAPLTLPVMRLVQQAMLPRSQPSVLAEVFLSGLLVRRPLGVELANPEDREYDFAIGVRELLLSGMPRHEQLAVLGKVSRFIARRLGSPNDFAAFLSGRAESFEVTEDRVFARVAYRLLASLGGHFGEVAEHLNQLVRAGLESDAPSATVPRMQPREPHGGAVTVSSSRGEADSGVLAVPHLAPIHAIRVERHAGDPRRIFFGVPARNPNFTGRAELLERLHAMMRAGGSQTALLPHALHGLGGVGKTQLAIEYAWRHAQEYDLVLWLRAESPTTLRQGYVDLAGLMGLGEGDVSKQILNVMDVLQDRRAFPRWLVVFENADAPEELTDYLPAFGNVLITSRNPEWAQVAEQIQVDVFTRDESVTLLRRRGSGISVVDADKLAARLGDLPLALDQAAAWQSATGAPVAELEHLLAERMAALMSEPPPANYPASLMATWDLAFTELNQRAPGAARLLELLAYFGSEPIAVPLLQESKGAGLPEPLGSVLRDEIKLRRAIREIGRYALAKPNAGRDEIEIHCLVQAVLRERLSPEQREATRDAVHRVIGSANPGYPDLARTWARHAELLPHITPSEVINGHSEAGHRAALDQIRYRFTRGDYERSVALGEVAVDTWRRTLGPDHEITLIAQRHLATSMREGGRYREAAELNQHTWDRMRAVFGDDHEHTLATMASIGRDLRLQGDYVAARKHDEDTWSRHRRALGHDDLLTLRAMNNYGTALRFLGEVGEALTVDQENLELRRQVTGPDDLGVVHVLGNVARNLADAGRYAEAHTLLSQAWPGLDRIGQAHRTRLMLGFGYAALLRRSGSGSRARELAEELYVTAQRGYPTWHEYPLMAASNFSVALLAVGESAPAKARAEQAWQGYKEAFGPENPATVAAALNLGVVLRVAGERKRAFDLDEQSLRMLRTTLAPKIGDAHPYLLVALTNLAYDHALASDFHQARDLSGQAYELSCRVRGEDHPETLGCGLNHALDLRATGDRAVAEELFERMQMTLRRDYGEQHPAAQAAHRMERVEAEIDVWMS